MERFGKLNKFELLENVKGLDFSNVRTYDILEGAALESFATLVENFVMINDDQYQGLEIEPNEFGSCNVRFSGTVDVFKTLGVMVDILNELNYTKAFETLSIVKNELYTSMDIDSIIEVNSGGLYTRGVDRYDIYDFYDFLINCNDVSPEVYDSFTVLWDEFALWFDLQVYEVFATFHEFSKKGVY